MTRDILPQRRASVSFTLRHWNQPITITLGFYSDDRLGEVFVNSGKSGTDVESTVRDAAVLLSLALQHGASLDTIAHALTRDANGSASGISGRLSTKSPITSVEARRYDH